MEESMERLAEVRHVLNHDDSFLGILKNVEQELDPVLCEMRTN
jgi:hypothetical protein